MKLKPWLALFAFLSCHAFAQIQVGVTLHPYYSFVANIGQDKIKVVPLIPEGFNPQAYEPRAQDIKNISGLDAVVLNDIGHDDFARKMIAASENKDVAIIQANKDVPLLSAMGLDQNNREGVINSHSFISISASMIQVNTIAQELGKLDPDNAAFYLKNAREYNKRLRKLRAEALAKIRDVENPVLKIATVHSGYDYLLREFGLEVTAVVEAAHGIEPSPAQLKKVVDLIKSQGVHILFAEKDNPSPYTATIAKEADVRLGSLSHITHGAYSPELFEQAMKENLDEVVNAILESQKP